MDPHKSSLKGRWNKNVYKTVPVPRVEKSIVVDHVKMHRIYIAKDIGFVRLTLTRPMFK